MFSDRLLTALGAWQNGWREEKDRRIPITEELQAAVKEDDLPERFRSCDSTCYRKRFLVPNNPQNDGDFGPLFLKGAIEEGVTAWTNNVRFAQDFKDPLRDGTISAVFAHTPAPGEVLVNVPALWADEQFKVRVKEFSDDGGGHAGALLNFRALQGEIIMDADLQYDEVYGLCGRSSPFDVLCDLEGLSTEDERDELWKALVASGNFPEEAWWLQQPKVRDVMDRAKAKFLAKHGDAIEGVLSRRQK